MPAGRKAVLVSLGSAALLTGCASTASGGSSPPASPTGAAPLPSATASAALPCEHITSLRTSLAGLAQMTGRAVSPRQIASHVAHAQNELTVLAGQAGAAAPQVSELRSELATVGKDARALAMRPSSSAMGALDTAARTLKSHAEPLIREMQAACPNQ